MKYILLTLFALFLSIASFATLTVSPVSKDTSVCINATVTLGDTTSGGGWSSSNTGIAVIDSATGLLTGINAGTAIITYAVGLDYATATVTVNPLPAIDTVGGGGSYCLGGSGRSITLSNSDTGINYQLYHYSFALGSPLPGSGSGLSWSSITAHGAYKVVAVNRITGCASNMAYSAIIIINPLPFVDTLYTGSGGHYCSGGAGVDVYVHPSVTGITYKLYNGGGSPIDSAIGAYGSPADFGLQKNAGAYAATATNSYGCLSAMSGGPSITILPLPPVCSITGGGSYCAKGTGVPIGLGCSYTGINYQLYQDGAPLGTALPGTTGSSLNFGLHKDTGTYTIIATNTSTRCADSMSGTETVSIIPLPTIITGNASICKGLTTTLSDSTAGGTWSSLATGIATINATTGVVTGLSAGTATIHYNTASCGYAGLVATVNPLPAVYTVSGGGAYCAGDVGAHVYLSNSDTGINYLLYDTVLITTRPGVGSLIDFGAQTASGTYIVVAANVVTGCTGNMAGSVPVYINPAPVPYTVTGGGHFCSGGGGKHVGLSGSAYGITYNLYVGGIHTGPTLAGTATSLDFGAFYTAGIYKVVANNITTGCTDTMYSSATITIDPVAAVTGTTAICAGTSSLLSASVSGGAWASSNTAIATVGSGGITSGISAGSALISYTLSTGCITVIGDTVNPLPAITGDSAVCTGSTITLTCPTGGTWATSNPSIATIATIGGSVGVVSGNSPGIDTLTYKLSTGCLSTATVTVLALPAITASATPVACGDTYTLTSTGGILYSWYPVTGISCDTCAVTMVNPVATTTYMVTGSGSSGCANTDTITVNGNRISGYIDFGGTPPATPDMKVWLIQYDPADSIISIPDSTVTCNVGGMGYYEFDGAPAGNYLVKAKLLYGNAPGSSGYVPTYSFSSPHWDSGAVIIHYSGSDTSHITMVYGTVPSGPGFISGNVFAGAGKGTSGNIPVAGTLVFLENEFTNVLTYTYTDGTGAYSFSNLGLGNYIIYPEEYLYSTNPSAVIILDGTNDSATNTDFKKYDISRNIVPYDIVTGISEIIPTNPKVTLYPNPNNGVLNIDVNPATGNTEIIIADMLGHEVYRSAANFAPVSGSTMGRSQINLQSLSDGIYIISVRSQDINYVGKLMIRK